MVSQLIISIVIDFLTEFLAGLPCEILCNVLELVSLKKSFHCNEHSKDYFLKKKKFYGSYCNVYLSCQSNIVVCPIRVNSQEKVYDKCLRMIEKFIKLTPFI